MSDTAAVQARLIGAIFVERGLISAADLEEALGKQAQTGERLGEIIVADYGVSRLELASVLAEQWADLEQNDPQAQVAAAETIASPQPPQPAQPAPAGEPEGEAEGSADAQDRRPIGEIFVERGFITQEQLQRALGAQRESGQRLGEILVQQGSISRLDLAGALAEQWAGLQKLRPPEPRPAPAPWQQRSPAEQEQVSQPERQRRDETLAELGEVRRAISALEDRLRLAEQAASGAGWQEELQASSAAISSRLDGLEARLGDLATRDELAAISELRIAIAETRAVAAASSTRLDGIEQRIQQLRDEPSAAGAVEELQEQVGALGARLADLDTADARAALEQLRSEVRELGELARRAEGVPDEIRALEERFELAAGALDAETRSAVEARIGEIERQIGSLAGDAARADLVAVADRVAALEGLVAGVRDSGGSASPAADELARRVDALATAVDEANLAGLRDGVDLLAVRWESELADSVSALASRIDGVETGAADRFLVEELRREVHRLAEPALAAQRLADELAALGERVDVQLAGRDADAAERRDDLARLESELGQLRRRTDEIAVAEGRLESLGARVEELSTAAPAPAVEVDAAVAEVERRLAERHDALEDAISARLDDLAGSVVRREEIDALASVVRELEEQSAASPDLQERVSLLAVRVQALADADGAALADLQSTLEELVQRDSAEVPERIAAVESRLSDFELAVRQRVDETLTVERAAREGIAVRLDDAVKRLAELQVLAQKVETLDERMQDLDPAEIESLRGRLEAVDALVGEGVRRQEDLLAEAEALSAQLDELAASAGAVDRIEAGQAGLERRAWELEARVADSVTHGELDGPASDLRTQLQAIEESLAERMPGAELSALREEIASDRARVTELRDALSGGQSTLAGGLTELEQMTAALSARVAGFDDLPGELARLRSELEAARGGADEIAELGSRLDAHRAALDEVRARVEDAVSRPELAGLAGDLRAQLQAMEESSTRTLSDLEQTAAALSDRVAAQDQLAGELSQLRSELEGRANAGEVAELRGRLEESGAAIEQLAGRASDAAVRSELAEVKEGLRAQLHALEQELARGATAAELSTIRQELVAERARVTELSDAVAGGHETLAEKLSRLEQTTSALAERVASHDEFAGGLSQLAAELQATRRGAGEREAQLTEMRAAIGSVTEAVDNLAERSATDAGELAARIDDVAIRSAAETAQALADLREEIGAGVRSELENTVSSVGWRLAKLEEKLSGPAADDLDTRLTQLEQGHAALRAASEAQTRAVEQAVRKGLKALARQMTTSEAAVIAARDTFRKAVDVLETAVEDPGATALTPGPTGEQTEPGYVAFVPRSDGYRLTDMNGPVVAVGDRIESPHGSGSLVVTRVGRSPLPFDERPCAYFEPVAA